MVLRVLQHISHNMLGERVERHDTPDYCPLEWHHTVHINVCAVCLPESRLPISAFGLLRQSSTDAEYASHSLLEPCKGMGWAPNVLGKHAANALTSREVLDIVCLELVDRLPQLVPLLALMVLCHRLWDKRQSLRLP